MDELRAFAATDLTALPPRIVRIYGKNADDGRFASVLESQTMEKPQKF